MITSVLAGKDKHNAYTSMSQNKPSEHPKYWSCPEALVLPSAGGISGWEMASSLPGAGIHSLQMPLWLVQR